MLEARDEFEDPEEDIRRIYVLKLFHGLQEWNYGLFVQEIFKLETKESLYLEIFNEIWIVGAVIPYIWLVYLYTLKYCRGRRILLKSS